MSSENQTGLALYGDFNCPWSYLASRRAWVLADAGVPVDFRPVEHDPLELPAASTDTQRFADLSAEMDLVTAHLLPDEHLPYALAGFVPRTKAAVSGYAETYAAGAADAAWRLLFQAFWEHAIDLGDPAVVRTLLADVIRGGHSRSDPVSEWGYSVSVSGGPVTSDAWRLARGWRAEWHGTNQKVVPILVVPDRQVVYGKDVVQWLGEQVVSRGLDPDAEPPVVPSPRTADFVSASWATQNGGRWLRDLQTAHKPRLFTP
ncbi:MAG: DsbA family protein [Nocardioidaceae bacterium]